MTSPVSVVVPTCNRPESCARTVASLLAAHRPGTEIIVVDQSARAETRRSIEALDGAGRIRYVVSRTRGASAARNHGVRLAGGELVLFTDDDCLADPQWIDAWRHGFAVEPAIGVGFGQVTCPPFDPRRGYTAGFDVREGSHGIELFRLGAGQVGISANMSMPRRVWEQLGGFDEGLGAGARFRSAEDVDFAYRAVRAGYRILHLGAARVWHHGYREGWSASQLVRGYVSGVAAMYVKHVRCGDWMALLLLGDDLRQHAAKVTGNLLNRTRPTGLGGLLSFLRGIPASWRCPVDQLGRVYRPGPRRD